MLTILLVDDNKDYRDVIQEVLEMEGYRVMPAENGAVALTLIQQSKPDLILSNGNMPVMTGTELLKVLKADEELNSIPFIMVTGRDENLSLVRDLGAVAVLIKPVPTDKLLSLINQILKS